jgi:uncharacterized protein with NRDE domain
MCSIILRVGPDGVFIGANRDEMISRAWQPPGEFWPGVIAGRDAVAGGTWLGLNRAGVMAAILNRHGSLGPAPGKRSRGDIPLLALAGASAAEAAAIVGDLDASAYRSFNFIAADASGAFFARGLESGRPDMSALASGVTMLTAGEPNDVSLPRIARHLPRFQAAAFAEWGGLLADEEGSWEEALNIPALGGFGTVCSSLISLRKTASPAWDFCPARPGAAAWEHVVAAA